MNLEQEIRTLKNRLDLLENRDVDLKGRRAINAGRAIEPSDLVTLRQAKDLFDTPEATRIIEQHLSTVAGGPFGIPVSLGDTNQQGSSQLYADAQHVHASGLTTKGDLLGYSTTLARVPVGADGVALISLASATQGVSWVSPWKGAKTKTLTDNTVAGLFEIALPTLAQAAGCVRYQVRVSDGTDVQSEFGIVTFAAVNVGGAFTTDIPATVGLSYVGSTISSLATTFTFATAANKVTFRVNANSSLSPTSMDIRYFLDSPDAQVVTFL